MLQKNMVDFSIIFSGTIYNVLIVASFLFFFEQIALIISIYRDDAGWHFRFNEVEGHGNLNPIVATWKISLLIFLITLVAIPIIGFAFSDILIAYVKTIEYNFLILVSSLLGAFFFIWHYIVEKGWNTPQIILLISSVICFTIPMYLTYFVI